MRDIDLVDDETAATVFRDVILLALAGFMTVVILLLPHINPEAKAEEDSRSPGNVVVEIRWPDQSDADVDLWVEAPADNPVGYSNQSGAIFNLLRDDTGHSSDVTALNYETSYSRGIVAGEYVVNLHYYRKATALQVIPVVVTVSVRPDELRSTRQILTSRVELTREGEERTVFRFHLTEDGELVPESVHDVPRALRARGAA